MKLEIEKLRASNLDMSVKFELGKLCINISIIFGRNIRVMYSDKLRCPEES